MSPGPIPRKLSDANCLVPSRPRRVRLWRRLSSLSTTPVGNRESQNGGAAWLNPLTWHFVSSISNYPQMFRASDIFHDPYRKKADFLLSNHLSLFFAYQGLLPFFARPWAIAVGSKPPLLTRFARIGLGTRLDTDEHSRLSSFHATRDGTFHRNVPSGEERRL